MYRYALLAAVFTALSTPALAGEIDLDDGLNAKLARIKAEKNVERNQNGLDEDEDPFSRESKNQEDECGSLNVGNVSSGGGFGGVPRNNTVIITGDVINAFNECK